jgi:hypothetical protein
MGHIVPGLSIASLMSLRVLCKVGCKVIFTDTKCEVKYQTNVFLHGTKDPATNLWTLPITPTAIGLTVDQKTPNPIDMAVFTHSVRTQANAVKFAHQSLCNLKISTLMKALKKGFLKGCPNISKTLVTKYLNPSPATAKGHMKRPKKGIRSTIPKPKQAKELPTGPCLPLPCLSQPTAPPIVRQSARIPGPSLPSNNRSQHHHG